YYQLEPSVEKARAPLPQGIDPSEAVRRATLQSTPDWRRVGDMRVKTIRLKDGPIQIGLVNLVLQDENGRLVLQADMQVEPAYRGQGLLARGQGAAGRLFGAIRKVLEGDHPFEGRRIDWVESHIEKGNWLHFEKILDDLLEQRVPESQALVRAAEESLTE